jgi:hypothetical protein
MNADSDLITREIVEVISFNTPTTVALLSQTINSFPSGGSGDFAKYAALYNEYRTLSQTIDYIPNFASFLVSSTNSPSGFVVAKVARGDTGPTLASLSDIDTACILAPASSTKIERIATIRMSSLSEGEFSQTNSPDVRWVSQCAVFFNQTFTSTMPPGLLKINHVLQFRGSL